MKVFQVLVIAALAFAAVNGQSAATSTAAST
ncbi:hypothetical protein PC110_g22917, partial [Phytophthora cactorum]